MTDADSINNYTTYHATNFKVDNWGINVNNTLFFRDLFGNDFCLNYLKLNYTYLHQKRYDQMNIYASSYALDYLRHKVVAILNSKIYGKLSAEISFRFQDRVGEFVKYSLSENDKGMMEYVANKRKYTPYALLGIKLLWQSKNIDVYLDSDNVTNKRYYDIGNVVQPGFWLMTGIKVRF